MPQFIALRPYWSPVWTWTKAHRAWSAVIFLALLGGAWFAYAKTTSTAGETRYMLGTVASSTIIATVSGSGQVSPSNQVDIKPKASGEITAVLVKQGDSVRAGQAIAYIDATDAQKSVRDAEANLESAQISLKKLQQPASALTLTQAQNALTNAQDALAKLYTDSNTDVTNVFLDLPDTVANLKDILTDDNAAGNSQWNEDFYANAISAYDTRGDTFKQTAHADYTAAKTAYDAAFSEYQSLGDKPDNASIEKALQDSYKAVQLMSKALKSTNAFIQLYVDVVKGHNNGTPASAATAALTSLNQYIGTINTHLSALLSDTNSLKQDKQTIIEKQQSLDETTAGADSLDIQSSQLSVTKAKNALTDAQNTLANYSVRAPFNGTVAKVDAKKGDQASSGTAAATLITTDQIADLSLNEVDAAKVKQGLKVTLTFDAIDGLSIAGTVASVDTLGTVSQGVVSYDVKIEFSTQDARVKPGMTVNASIITDTAQDALSVPSSAVKTQNGQSYVQIFSSPLTDTAGTGVVSKNAPQNVPVTVGISDDTNVQILSGLSLGEQIVVRTITGTASTAAAGRTTTGGAGGGRTGGGGNFFRAL